MTARPSYRALRRDYTYDVKRCVELGDDWNCGGVQHWHLSRKLNRTRPHRLANHEHSGTFHGV